MGLAESVKKIRECGVPIASITSVDEPATVTAVVKAINNKSIILHDIVRGFSPVSEEGQKALPRIMGESDPIMFTNPQSAISSFSANAPDNSALLMIGAPRWLDDKGSQQALANSRDILKGAGSIIILIGFPGMILPTDLATDIVSLDDPAATQEQRAAIVASMHSDAGIAGPTPEVMAEAIAATRGLSSYAVEQAVALSITPSGIDQDALRDRWRAAINSTPGLKVDRSGAKITDIGGLDNLKAFAQRVMKGRDRPSAIIRIDEVEKALAGSGTNGQGGDSSGASQAIVGALLTYMEEKNQTGLIAIGPPGTGKSESSRAIGSIGNVPTIVFDLGALKGGIVGQTEANTRKTLGMLGEIVGEKALWVATCNSIGALSPEFKARFHYDTWFFDLPNTEERKAIWKVWLAKYPQVEGELPDDTGWVGREIRRCVEISYRLSISPKEAAMYIVPYSTQSAEVLSALRKQANGRFLSASYAGTYNESSAEPTTKRKQTVDAPARKFSGISS